jgi:protein-S-isoprenylcysteine O-methyltransferase Ste14
MYLMLAGQLFAAVLEVVGVLQTDTLSFIGVRQLFEGYERPSKLVIRGLYRWVRHPLYSAGLLFIWLTPVMSQNSLILYTAITVYILVGAFFEEKKLVREFGADYEAYRRGTAMLVPGLVFRRNK